MPSVQRFFANSKVSDWTGRAMGGGGAAGVTATGGEVQIYASSDPAVPGYYVSHYFRESGNFTMAAGEVTAVGLVVGGGGGPGGWGYVSGQVGYSSGGGGAGAFIEVPSYPLSPTGGPGNNGVYPIVVGAGATDKRTNGSATTALGQTAPGGGAGGGQGPNPQGPNPPGYANDGYDGASGGGAPGWPQGTNSTSWPSNLPYSGHQGVATHPSGNPGGIGDGNPGNYPGYNYTGGGGGGGSGPGGGVGGDASHFPSNVHPSWAFGGKGGTGTPSTLRRGTPQMMARGGGGRGPSGVGTYYNPELLDAVIKPGFAERDYDGSLQTWGANGYHGANHAAGNGAWVYANDNIPADFHPGLYSAGDGCVIIRYLVAEGSQ